MLGTQAANRFHFMESGHYSLILKLLIGHLPRDTSLGADLFKSIPEETVFPALPRRSRRGSTHTTVARGTALLESLVGKPQWKATDPLIHTSASVTLLLQVVRKWQVHAPTRDED